jgi:TRAP-type C4-dicarboxylate transport system permease small subunit
MLIERVRAANFDFITGAFQSVEEGGESDLPTLIGNIVNLILFIAGVLAIIYLIYSGILYITAAGNPDAAKKGQQGLMNAAIGIVIIVLAFFIARAVVNYAQSSVAGTDPEYGDGEF